MIRSSAPVQAVDCGAPAGRSDFAAELILLSLGPSSAFARLCENVDVLVHMCYQISGSVPDAWAKGAAGHLEAARVAKEAGAGSLVVSHIPSQMDVPGLRERLIREMGSIYPGNIYWGEDRMVIPVHGPRSAGTGPPGLMSRRLSMSRALIAFAALLVLAITPPCAAQTYPARPERIIASYPAGGGVDVMARLVAQHLGQKFGQQFVVENRVGASGTIGNIAAPAWFAFLAPFAVPAEIRGRLEQGIREALAEPDLRAKLTAMGLDVIALPAGPFADLIRAESAYNAQTIRRLGYKPD